MPTRPTFGRLCAMLALGLSLLAGPATAQETGTWLDQPLANWNQAGRPIPAAPATELVNPRCVELARWPETPQDQALVDAGWKLFGAYRAGWGAMVIDATAGYDGMCRPLAYQSFVFADGAFAGTISPEPMISRTTGAGTVLNLVKDTLSARFRRYASTDPLCCPSRPAVSIQYTIERTPNGPVLTPTQRFEERSGEAA